MILNKRFRLHSLASTGIMALIASGVVMANDTALRNWGDEYGIDRHAIVSNSEAKTKLSKRIELKTPIGFYVGSEDSPESKPAVESAEVEASSSSSDQQQFIDTYIGIRQSGQDFSYNVGFKSYNKNLMQKDSYTINDFKINEMYLGGRFKNIGIGVAQNELYHHTRASYFYLVANTALQFDLGQTITETGDNYYAWKFNMSKMFYGLAMNLSLTKNITPTDRKPTEVLFEVARPFNLK